MTSRQKGNPLPPRRLVYGVTSGESADTLLRGQLNYMQSRGWDVTLISSPGKAHERTVQREQVNGHPIPMQRDPALISDIHSLIQWVQALRRIRPDVVSVGTPKAALLGMIASWLTRVPKRVYVMRGLRLEGAAGLRRFVLSTAEWLTIKLSTDTVVVSRSLGTAARRSKVVGKSMLLIGDGSSNGVDSQRFQPSTAATRTALRDSLGIDGRDYVLGFVGRLSPDKGTDLLAESIALLDTELQARAVLLLVGPVESQSALDRLTESAVSIIAIGWTDAPETYFAAMDTLILPTKREGFPNVVLEAACCELSTITTRATGAVDSVIHDQTGLLVAPESPSELATAIEVMGNSRALRLAMGKAAKEHVEESFPQRRIWDGLANIYSDTESPDIVSV